MFLVQEILCGCFAKDVNGMVKSMCKHHDKS